MKVISLEASNILRLEAILIKCEGKNVTLTGANTSGKTSVLRCISMALGGSSEIPEEPIHRGAKKGFIDMDIGDYKIRRTFTAAGGGTITVTAKDGTKQASPQAILDGLVGKLTFDPLEFTRMKADKQVETLRKLVGLDFSQIDAERKKVYDERTLVNREVDSKKALLANQASFPDAPKEEVTLTALNDEMDAARVHNLKLDTLKLEAQRTDKAANDSLARRKSSLARIDQLYAEIKRLIDETNADGPNHIALDKAADDAAAAVDSFVPVDVAPIRARMSTIEETNRKVRQNAQVAKVEIERDDAIRKGNALTAAIDKLDVEKEAQLAAAVMPIDGLSFTDIGIVYKGMPFTQASAAEQLRVSAAMGISMNPTLKVLLVRDGSLLDQASLAILKEVAGEDWQLWIEKVSDHKDMQVIIEEGEAS